MLNRLASLEMSTSILKALPGKLDIKRYSPSILYVSFPDLCRLSYLDLEHKLKSNNILVFSVNGHMDLIIQHPADVTVEMNGAFILEVGAMDVRPIQYQWYRNEQMLMGRSTAILEVSYNARLQST